MLKITLGNSALQATGLAKHPTANVAVVTFSDGSKAAASLDLTKGYFKTEANGDLVPSFLTAEGKLMPGYELRTINGTNWIQNTNNQFKLTL